MRSKCLCTLRHFPRGQDLWAFYVSLCICLFLALWREILFFTDLLSCEEGFGLCLFPFYTHTIREHACLQAQHPQLVSSLNLSFLHNRLFFASCPTTVAAWEKSAGSLVHYLPCLGDLRRCLYPNFPSVIINHLSSFPSDSMHHTYTHYRRCMCATGRMYEEALGCVFNMWQGERR